MPDNAPTLSQVVPNLDAKPPRHVAIIMDGNGRWATKRGMLRTQGHRAGVDAAKRVVRAAADRGVEYLTLYSFSSENWARPKSEISELFSLMKLFIRRDLAELHQNNVRVRVIGARGGLPGDILALLTEAENLTRHNSGQTLVIAFNYGARDEIAGAMRRLARRVETGELSAEDIEADMIGGHLDTAGIPDPDLVIRTSGEIRLSNFLLWQAAYSELVFVDCLWPDFDEAEFDRALDEFHRRNRRFGGLVQGAAS